MINFFPAISSAFKQFFHVTTFSLYLLLLSVSSPNHSTPDMTARRTKTGSCKAKVPPHARDDVFHANTFNTNAEHLVKY
jgi:hypothetical protein